MYKKCLENFITLHRQNNFKCYLCHKETKNNFEAILDHIEINKHIDKINNLDGCIRSLELAKLSTVTNEQIKTIVNNHITYDKQPHFFRCHICKCSISGLSNTLQHIQGSAHETNREEIYGKKVVIQEKKAINALNSKSFFINISYCSECHVYLKDHARLYSHSMLHLNKNLVLENKIDQIDIIKFTFNKKYTIIKCLLCNMFIENDQYIHDHLNTELHSKRLNLFSNIKEDVDVNNTVNNEIDNIHSEDIKFDTTDYTSTIFCTLCDVAVPKGNLKEHSNGRNHNNLLLSKNIENFKNIEVLQRNLEADNANCFICFLCEIMFSNKLQLLKHYKSLIHKIKLKYFNLVNKSQYINFVTRGADESIICSLCNSKFYSVVTIIAHLLGRRHNARLKSMDTPLNSNSECNPNTNINSNSECNVNSNKNIGVINNNQVSIENTSDIKNVKKKKNVKQNVSNCNLEEFRCSSEELMKLGFSSENIQPTVLKELNSNELDDMLNSLVNLDIKHKLPRSIKEKKPRTPNTEQKAHFTTTVSHFGKNFIKLCIDTGERNIYNLKAENIRLLKLGIMLTFPTDSETMQVCLPCGIKFPNNRQLLFDHLQYQEHIQSMHNIEANDKQFENYPDQYSDLKLAKCYIQEDSDEWVTCFACNEKVKNDNTDIYLHTLNTTHVTTSALWKNLSEQIYEDFLNIFKESWYYAQVFLCTVCNAKFHFEIDFVKHLEDVKHLEKAIKKEMKDGHTFNYYLCPVCITYWYGKSDSTTEHCKDPFHQRFVQSGDFTIPQMTASAIDLISDMDEKIQGLIIESDKIVQDKDKECEVLKAIEETVGCMFPTATAYTFGSRLSNLGFTDSDLDVFLDCENIYQQSATEQTSQHYISLTKNLFESKSNIWIVDEILLITRVPIIKLRHIPTGLKCDLSFSNGLSVEKSKLIGFYNMAYPICRQLILYFKKWLAFCRLSGSDSITTFAISWCVIFYLQVKGILPSVFDLIKLQNNSQIVDGWVCGFTEDIPVKDSNLNFREHVKGFLSYYGQFNYKTNVICPYLGKVIQKRNFAYTNTLPEEMNLYKARVAKDDSKIFRFDSPFCLQDPIDLSQNITKAVKKLQLRCFRQYCIGGLAELLGDKNTVTV